MGRCPACGSGDLHTLTRAEHRYSFAGLPNIILRDVTVLTCPRCGRSDPEVPDVDRLKGTIAQAIVGKRERLMPAEIRFLRKRLGLSALELAAHLGTTPESVSRWENGRTPMGATVDRLLRLMVVVATGSSYSLSGLRTVPREKPKATAIHVRRDDDRWEVSIGRPTNPAVVHESGGD